MSTCEVPVEEPLRLEDLRALKVLDSSDEPAFDRVATLASTAMGTPTALISLVDANRQWFKAKVGLDARETPRKVAFCRLAIHDDEPLIVEDATLDERFAANPLVTGDPHIRFYAGAPLIVASGRRMGTLCAIDYRPRQPTREQITTLKQCAAIACDLLAMRRDLLEARAALAEKEASDPALSIARLSHDLRTPLNHIIGFARMIEDKSLGPIENAKYREYGSIIRSSANHLFDAVDGVMRTELTAHKGVRAAEEVDLRATLKEVVQSFEGMAHAKGQSVRLAPVPHGASLRLSATPLRRILINLIANACKYCQPAATITVSLRPEPGSLRYGLEVADDGPGIPAEVLSRMGDADQWLARNPSRGGHGLGLGNVARICKAMGWSLGFECPPEGGTMVRVSLGDVGV